MRDQSVHPSAPATSQAMAFDRICTAICGHSQAQCPLVENEDPVCHRDLKIMWCVMSDTNCTINPANTSVAVELHLRRMPHAVRHCRWPQVHRAACRIASTTCLSLPSWRPPKQCWRLLSRGLAVVECDALIVMTCSQPKQC